MASKGITSGSSFSELEAGNKSVDIWKTKDVKREFVLEEAIFRISLLPLQIKNCKNQKHFTAN